MYPQRPAASRGNAYPAPDALTGEKRDKYMMFGNFDCKNAGGERMTQVPDTSDDPSCFVQQRPRGPGQHVAPPRADYARPTAARIGRRPGGALALPRQARYGPAAAGDAAVGRGHDGRGRRVDVDRVVDVAGVAAGEDDDDGGAGAAQALDDQLVAGPQAGLGQRQAPEAVALERVGAGEVEGDVGAGAGQRGVEGVVERAQVVAVAGPGRRGRRRGRTGCAGTGSCARRAATA